MKSISDPVSLRPIQEEDLPLILTWRNHPESRKWFFNQNRITEEQHKGWFLELKNSPDEFFFIIEDSVGQPVGTVSLYNLDKISGSAEYGRMLIDPDRRGERLAFKATIEVLNLGFSEFNLDDIHLEVMADNSGAVDLYEKVGFKRKSEFTKKINGNAICIYKMEISKSDYFKNNFGEP